MSARPMGGAMGRLDGKRAFVTGAGQGIGRAVALAFAHEGAAVVAASRTPGKMEDLPALAPTIKPVGLDVTDGPAVERTIAAEGPFDILFNGAGWVHSGTILDCSEADWARSLDQNVTSMFRTIRAALPAMLERRSGAIINVASVASSLSGVPGRAAYGASKAAVIGLTKAVARDVIAHGVRCNALCPGTTHTPSLEERIAAAPDPEAARRQFVARQPMGRLGDVAEMAAAAVYLASDDAAFTTGTVLVVDGGQTL
ncbi:SDR family oxidoreductase [Inquilinus limosus]|uniref:SDR family oxidoreductase n=1 Tax=Inquilinus limosus TaxID=171674 RepID=UPI003F5CC6B9